MIAYSALNFVFRFVGQQILSEMLRKILLDRKQDRIYNFRLLDSTLPTLFIRRKQCLKEIYG